MQQANKFNRPIVTFIDTKGAYPGNTAEERGQSEAIASNLREMAMLRSSDHLCGYRGRRKRRCLALWRWQPDFDAGECNLFCNFA